MTDQPTPTPRTNEKTFHRDSGEYGMVDYVVDADFARELERELRFNEQVSKQIFAANERLERELAALAFAAARVEWKYGRTDDGKPKDWKEWNDLRECLGDRVRQPQELAAGDSAILAETNRNRAQSARIAILERELSAERALADRLATWAQEHRNAYMDQVPHVDCICGDCQILPILDADLAAWKEARNA